VQLAEIIRTDCTVMALEAEPCPEAIPEPEVPPVIEPVDPDPVAPLPLVVEPVEPEPEPEPDEPDPVAPDDDPLPIELSPAALLIVPRISIWWPTCLSSSEVLPVRR